MTSRTSVKSLTALLMTALLLFGAVLAAAPVYAAAPSDVILERANSVEVANIASDGSGSLIISIRATNLSTTTAHTVTVKPVIPAAYATSVALRSVSVNAVDTASANLTADDGSDPATNVATFRFTFDIVNAATQMYTIPFVATVSGETYDGTAPTHVQPAVDGIVRVIVADPPTPVTPVTPDPVVYQPSASLGYSVSDPSGKIVAGEDNILTLTMSNTGDCSLESAELQIGQLPDGIYIFNTSDRKQLGKLNRVWQNSTNNPNTSAAATFHITTKAKLETGVYAFPVTMSGYDPNGSRWTSTETLYIQVSGVDPKDDDKKEDDKKDDEKIEFTPILMVSNFSQGGTALAGKTFSLNLTLQNTSDKELKNIKVTVGDGGGVFVPSGNSNSYYISSIPAGSSDTHTMRLSVNKDAAQMTTPVSITMAYEDEKAKSFTASDTIAIPVVQETRLVIENLSPITYAFAGETTSAELPIYNMGKNVISNVKVKVEGDFDVTKNASVFVGNMNAGTSYTYKFNMVPYGGGEATGTITVSYDDAAGNQQLQEIPFKYTVQSYEPYDPGVDEPIVDPGIQPQPAGPFANLPWKWIAVGGAVLLVALILIIRGAKKRKAAKALELDDADDEPNGTK